MSSDTDTVSEIDSAIPQPLTAMYEPAARDLSPADLNVKCQVSYDKMKATITPALTENLQEVTSLQSQCNAWKIHRAGRVTGSTFHRVLTCKPSSIVNLVKKMMQYEDKELSVPAVLWGKQMEVTARQRYLSDMKSTHKNFKLKTVGLTVKADQPYLAASPDGVWSCDCCGSGVLEIKCPFKYREGLQGSELDADFCLDSHLELRKSHPYYAQVQLQMYACQLGSCDFMVWTKQNALTHRVQVNSNFLTEALPKAEEFFMNHLLPELICRRHDPLLVEVNCTTCKRPSFGKMIACTNCGQQFHYECVHIVRKTKNWTCGCQC